MHIFRFHPQISDSVGLQEGLRLCIFNEFPDAMDAVGQQTTLWKITA